MFWRFLVADDQDVELFVVRDSDSRIEERDVAGIRAFVASDRAFYCIYDHRYHIDPIMGGMWGAHRGKLARLLGGHSMQQLAVAWAADNMPIARKGMDQVFLRETVWPLVKADALNLVLPAQHPQLCFGAAECVAASPPLYPPPSPVPGPDPEDYVGRICDPEQSYICKQVAKGDLAAGLDPTQGFDAKVVHAMDAVAPFITCERVASLDWRQAYRELTGSDVDLPPQL